MEITDVQVKLIGNGDERLKASCTIAIDGEFVVRDVKVIEGTSGLFVAMPSRKLTDHCPKCGHKNHLRSRYCNHCGARLGDSRWSDRGSATQLHAEIAHPINRDCRERLHKRVIDAYEAARQERAAEKGRPEPVADVDTDVHEAEPAAVPQDSTGVEESRGSDSAPQPPSTPADVPTDSTDDGDVSSSPERDKEDGFGAGLV